MKKCLIHFSGDDFWISNPHSRYHIVKAFWANNYDILWINPIGVRFPSLKKKGSSSRIIRKVKSLSKLLRKVDNNFHVFTPFLIPQFSDSKIEIINNALLRAQINLISFIIGIKKPILFFTSPLYANAEKYIRHIKSIYYYSDKYTQFRELSDNNKKYLESLDKHLYKNADLILCASKLLFDDLHSKTNKPVQYIPHQVDYDFFHKNKESDVPKELLNVNHPIIGYYGTLTPSNDWELIDYITLKRPDYNFIFIGRKEIFLEELENRKNVFFLGKKEYEEIPSFGKQFDVCIMFWTIKEWIKNSSPLKLKEYFSLGKPVVSTYINEVAEKFGDIVYVANNNEEFLEYLDKSVNEDNSNRVLKAQKIVENDSWVNVVCQIEKHLNE